MGFFGGGEPAGGGEGGEGGDFDGGEKRVVEGREERGVYAAGANLGDEIRAQGEATVRAGDGRDAMHGRAVRGLLRFQRGGDFAGEHEPEAAKRREVRRCGEEVGEGERIHAVNTRLRRTRP